MSQSKRVRVRESESESERVRVRESESQRVRVRESESEWPREVRRGPEGPRDVQITMIFDAKLHTQVMICECDIPASDMPWSTLVWHDRYRLHIPSTFSSAGIQNLNFDQELDKVTTRMASIL